MSNIKNHLVYYLDKRKSIQKLDRILRAETRVILKLTKELKVNANDITSLLKSKSVDNKELDELLKLHDSLLLKFKDKIIYFIQHDLECIEKEISPLIELLLDFAKKIKELFEKKNTENNSFLVHVHEHLLALINNTNDSVKEFIKHFEKIYDDIRDLLYNIKRDKKDFMLWINGALQSENRIAKRIRREERQERSTISDITGLESDLNSLVNSLKGMKKIESKQEYETFSQSVNKILNIIKLLSEELDEKEELIKDAGILYRKEISSIDALEKQISASKSPLLQKISKQLVIQEEQVKKKFLKASKFAYRFTKKIFNKNKKRLVFATILLGYSAQAMAGGLGAAKNSVHDAAKNLDPGTKKVMQYDGDPDNDKKLKLDYGDSGNKKIDTSSIKGVHDAKRIALEEGLSFDDVKAGLLKLKIDSPLDLQAVMDLLKWVDYEADDIQEVGELIVKFGGNNPGELVSKLPGKIQYKVWNEIKSNPKIQDRAKIRDAISNLPQGASAYINGQALIDQYNQGSSVQEVLKTLNQVLQNLKKSGKI